MDIKMRLEKHDVQHYVAIGRQIEMRDIPTELPQLIPETEKWRMAGRNIYPMNVMTLFLKNALGKDMNTSLVNLKNILDKQ
jgi:hypothetical protein